MSRPSDARRAEYAARFGIVSPKLRKRINGRLMEQLDRCQSDIARKLILGIGEQDVNHFISGDNERIGKP